MVHLLINMLQPVKY